jgi:cell division transport system permease protein
MRLGYMARETSNNLRRNLLMTSAAVMTVAVSLALVGGALLLRQGVDRATLQWKGGVEMNIFLDPDVTDQQRGAVEAKLKAAPEVKRYSYVDQQGAYEEAKELFVDQPELLEPVTAEDMPPSFRVVPYDAEQVEVLEPQFDKEPGVMKVTSAKEQIRTLVDVTRALRLAIMILAILVMGSAAVLILNTIRMAIFARRREVGVQKLVGATNWFIRIPFMLEGMLQGLFGAALAFGGVALARNFTQGWLQTRELFQNFAVTRAEVLQTGMVLLILGAAIGAVFSAFAVSRFLDV